VSASKRMAPPCECRTWYVTKYALTRGVVVCEQRRPLGSTTSERGYVFMAVGTDLAGVALRPGRDAFETEAEAKRDVRDRWHRELKRRERAVLDAQQAIAALDGEEPA
jgi:hypothetical protein